MSFAVYAIMRNKDIYEIRSRFLSVLPAQNSLPRRYRTVLMTTKNDPTGSGPIENREYLVPCICSERMNASEKRSFTLRLKSNPNLPCDSVDCPYGAIRDYLALCPHPFGVEGKDLRFMRSRVTRGELGFTQGNMGEHTMQGIANRMNDLLPEHLKIEKATGHSGRHTGTSIAVNSGVDSSVIAKVSHHKDPRALAIYQKQDEAVRLSTALAIGSSSGRKEEEEEVAVDKEGDEKQMKMGEDDAFLKAWRLGQKRVRETLRQDDDDEDGSDEVPPSTKKKQSTINKFYFYS